MSIDTTLQQHLDHVAVGKGITRGGVTFIPVYLHHERPGAVAVAPGAGVRVTERPNADVPTLLVQNPGDAPALLVEGEIVEGGRQTRSLNVTVLVGANSTLEIPVSCVEQGRWGGGSEFARRRALAPRRVRRSKVGSVGSSVRRSGERYSDQGAVWNVVDHELVRLQAHSASRSLAAAEEALGRDDEATRIVDELVQRGPLPGQCGVVIAHGSRIVSAEVFATAAMLAAYWEGIVRAAIMDAPEEPPTSKPSLTRAVKFLRTVAKARATVTDGVGLGREYHVESRSIVAQALVHDTLLVHASAFALAA